MGPLNVKALKVSGPNGLPSAGGMLLVHKFVVKEDPKSDTFPSKQYATDMKLVDQGG